MGTTPEYRAILKSGDVTETDTDGIYFSTGLYY